MAHVQLPSWASAYTTPNRYKVAYGGRASSKTWTFAHLIILRAVRERIRVACCRSIQDTLRESTKQTLELAIERMKLTDEFFVGREVITCPSTGSHIFFSGLEKKRESIRGWEDVDVVWADEAHMMSSETANILIPTIRKPGHELWFTFNPLSRTDWVYQRFVDHPRDGDLVTKVNWRDNPWFPDESDEERVACQIDTPTLYQHIWEGFPDDGGGDERVLSYAVLRECVRAFDEGLHREADEVPVHVGLDVADAGQDANAVVVRRGPVVTHVDAWHSRTPGFMTPTATKADRVARDYDADTLYWDGGGVGAPLRGEFTRIYHEENGGGYSFKSIQFGGAVGGPDRYYMRGRTNKEYFARRSGQLAFAVRLRALRTIRLLAGEDVDPNTCLFIDSTIPALESYLGELSQPIWRDNPTTGKVEVWKRTPDEKSPDKYDATVMAFARDSERGLRTRGSYS